MKKLLVSVLVLFVLCGATVFAQESDDSFVDVSDVPPIESYLGFAFAIDIGLPKEGDTETRNVPSILLGARQYFMDLNGMEAGYSVFLSAGFIPEMDWAGMKIKSSDADLMMNFGALVGGSIRGDIGDSGLGFVADLGFAFNMDMARWTTDWYTPFIGAGYMERGVVDLMSTTYGVGLNAALQYRMAMDASALIFEVGVNFAYNFLSDVTIEGRTEYNDGDPDWVWVRIAPYLAVGWKF